MVAAKYRRHFSPLIASGMFCPCQMGVSICKLQVSFLFLLLLLLLLWRGGYLFIYLFCGEIGMGREGGDGGYSLETFNYGCKSTSHSLEIFIAALPQNQEDLSLPVFDKPNAATAVAIVLKPLH